MAISPVAVVEQYLQALQAKDLTQLPLAETIHLRDPLAGNLTGKGAVLEFLAGVLPILKQVKIQRHLSSGNTVITQWEAITVLGTISILEWFEIEADQIQVAQAFFDPRLITQAQ